MRACSAWHLHPIADAAVLQLLDAVDGEGGAGTVADESFTAFVVVRRDAHAAVHVEAVVRRAEAAGLAVEALVLAWVAIVRSKRAREARAAGERKA